MAAPHSKPAAVKSSQKPKSSSRGKSSTSTSSSAASKRKSKPAAKSVQQKTKSTTLPSKKKKRVYTDKELGIPLLNGIRPAGVQKPPNAKKGKNFVDDKEGMSAILALVLAEKEGNIESKTMRARQMEEIREAKKAAAEKRVESKKRGLEERKQDIKDSSKKRRRRYEGDSGQTAESEQPAASAKRSKKRVSFG